MMVFLILCVVFVFMAHRVTCMSVSSVRSFVWSVTNNTMSRKWTKMTSDSTGQFMAVIDHVSDSSHIYVSQNFGVNWTKAAIGPAHYSSISSSLSGNLLTATVSGGGMTFSKDHGATWQRHVKSPSNYWTSIVSDDKGQHLAAVVHLGGVYVSKDGGDTWTQTSAPSSEVGWISVTTSSSGEHLVAVASTGEIYYSSNYGEEWSKSQVKKPKLYWSAVASDPTGKFVAAVSTAKGDATSVIENGLHYSNDYGKTFKLKYHMAKLSSVSMDDSGTVLVSILTDSCNNMYVAQSFDSGDNFETSTAGAGQWSHVMINGKGDRVIATQSSGLISMGVIAKKKNVRKLRV